MKVWTFNISLWYVFQWALHEQSVKSDSPSCIPSSYLNVERNYQQINPY